MLECDDEVVGVDSDELLSDTVLLVSKRSKVVEDEVLETEVLLLLETDVESDEKLTLDLEDLLELVLDELVLDDSEEVERRSLVLELELELDEEVDFSR